MEINIWEKLKVKINLWTKVEICISSYMNADLVLDERTWTNATLFVKLLIEVKN